MGWLRHRGAQPGIPRPRSAPAKPVAAAPVSPAGWAFLPPLQRTIGSAPAATAPRTFPGGLSAWRDPSFTGRMSHAISPAAPAGVIDADGGGLGAGTGTPAVTPPQAELTLLLPAAALVQRAARAPLVASAPPAATKQPGAALTSADPSSLPVLHLAAQPADPAQTGPGAPAEPVVDTAVPQITAPDTVTAPPEPAASASADAPSAGVLGSAAGTGTFDSGALDIGLFDNGGATSVPLPAPPVQRSTAATTPLPGRPAPPPTGPRQQRRLGLGAPLPSVPAQPVRGADRTVQRTRSGADPGPTAAGDASASATLSDTIPLGGPQDPSADPPPESADPAPERPATVEPVMVEPATLLPMDAARPAPQAALPLVAQRTSDGSPVGTGRSRPADATLPLAADGTDAPEPPPTDTERPDAALLGAREPQPPVPAPAHLAAAPHDRPTTSMPLQRATGSRAAESALPTAPPTPAPDAGAAPEHDVTDAVTDAVAAPPALDALPAAVQRHADLLGARALVPLLSPEQSPTMPDVPARTATAHRPSVHPAAPITLLAPSEAPDHAGHPGHARPVATLSAAPVPSPAARVPESPAPLAETRLPVATVQRADDTAEPDAAMPPDPDVPQAGDAAAPEPAVPAAPSAPSAPDDAAAAPGTHAPARTGTPESAPSQEQLDELARRLMPPLTRRLRAQLLIDRERRGLRSDPC